MLVIPNKLAYGWNKSSILYFSFILSLKLSRITFLLIKIKMSRFHHFKSLEYPVKENLIKKIRKIQNKIAHGGNYKPIFARIPFAPPQLIPLSD